MTYLDFLSKKVAHADATGFEPKSAAHESLFGHQKDVAHWMARGGRRACFMNFGLGKTRTNLQVGNWVTKATGGKYLIIAPLGVRQEFTMSDGPALGLDVRYVKNNFEAKNFDERILITNYERVRDGDIDVTQFAGVGLDEASCLRSYGSKTYQEFLIKFKEVKYKFVFTATPSPNRYKELIHYAGFLGIMDTGQALTRFFQRDSEQAGNLTLMPHMEERFWYWLNTWACFIQRPSDLGYSDEGYDLPPMKVHWHRIAEDYKSAWGNMDSWGQRQLLPEQNRSLRKSAQCKRSTIELRVQKMREIVEAEPDENWLLWHDLEDERKAIEKIPGVVSICGSTDLELREKRIMEFTNGEIKRFASKPSISGSGCNFQRHCARAVFSGVNYKFNDFIQSIHRIYRFLQVREVHMHILHLESEDAIRDELEAKWQRHNQLMQRMAEMVKQHKLSNIKESA